MQEQHFNKVKQSVNLDEWVFWHYKCCQETPSTSTSQPVELSIRVPLLERSRLCAISWPISPNGFSRVLINRDFNSSGQGLWLSVQLWASRGASLRRPCPVNTGSSHQWHHNEALKFSCRTRCWCARVWNPNSARGNPKATSCDGCLKIIIIK